MVGLRRRYPAGRDGALFSFLACAKHSAVADPDSAADMAFVNALLGSRTRGGVVAAARQLAEQRRLSPAEIHRAHPHLTVTSITPFGLEGPWRDRPATEFTLQAWSGGIIGLGRGSPDRAPVFVGGQVGEWLAGAYAGAATLAIAMRRSTPARGELVDLSMLETQILGLTYYPVTYFEMLGRPWRTELAGSPCPASPQAKDGLVDARVRHAQQWFDLCAMVGHPEWIDEESPLSITEQANEQAAEIHEWVKDQTVEEIRELATAFRIPNAPVANGANIATLDHFRRAGRL